MQQIKKYFVHCLFGFTVMMIQGQTPKTQNNLGFETPYQAVKNHLYYLQKENYNPQKAAISLANNPDKTTIKAAIKLKAILDGGGFFVQLNKLPRNKSYKDTLNGFDDFHQYWLSYKEFPEIYLAKKEGFWQYSKETVAKINTLYQSVYPWPSDWVQDYVSHLNPRFIMGLALWQYAVLISLLIIAFFLFWMTKSLFFILLKSLQKGIFHFHSLDLENRLKTITQPLALIVGVYFLKRYLAILHFSVITNALFAKSLRFASVVLWIYICLKLVEVIVSIYGIYAEKTPRKLDDQLKPILHRLLKGGVLAFGTGKILVIFGLDVTTVLAVASVGGLALALASQDTVKNLIGTLMIFTDKPFQIGDWIVSDEVTGTVEEVGLRSTKIRAADTSVFFITNSKLSEIVINNKGLLKFRRYTTKVGIRYDTPPDLIRAFKEGLEKVIIAYPDTNSDNYNVAFVNFGDSALEILINVYFTSTDWSKEQASKHGLHLAILDLAKALGIDFAFPSQTLMLESTPEKGLEMNYQTDKAMMDRAIEKAVKEIK